MVYVVGGIMTKRVEHEFMLRLPLPTQQMAGAIFVSQQFTTLLHGLVLIVVDGSTGCG